MEQKLQNLKKWGWWAVAGLVAVLVIAGLIIAIAKSGPKPADEVAKTPETTNNDNEQKETEKPAEQPAARPELPEPAPADLPKTGPEDTILPIIGASAVGYLVALGVTTIRRRN
jgi:predicted flap endonuclease-1-like 5' DNA nuclease